MKKVFVLVFISLFLFLLIGCEKTSLSTTVISTVSTTSGSNETTTTPTTATTTSELIETTVTTKASLSQSQVDLFSAESVTLELSYYLPSNHTEEFNLIIAAFEALYPNVDIVLQRELDSKGVASKFIMELGGNIASDLILTDQEYLSIASPEFEPLDYYIQSDAVLNDFPVGVNLENFETNLFSNYRINEGYVTFPFTRMTQLVFANSDLLATNKVALGNAGILISDSGYLMDGLGMDFDGLETIASVINDRTTFVIEMPYYTFPTWMGQTGITIFQDDEYFINQTNLIDLMAQIRDLSNNQIISLPSNFDDSYSSQSFNYEETVFASSGPDSLRYMIEYSTFKVDIYSMIQSENDGALFYGSDFAINENSSDIEKFYSWLFIRFATDLNQNYMKFCLDYGYSPIYKESIYEANDEYIDFLLIAEAYHGANGLPDWTIDSSNWDNLDLSMVQFAYQMSRQNVFQRSFLLEVNTIAIDNNRIYWNDYADSVFYSNDNLESLSTSLEDDLND